MFFSKRKVVHNLREAYVRDYQTEKLRMKSGAKTSVYGKVKGCLAKYPVKKWFSSMRVVCRLPQAWYVDWDFIFVCSSLCNGDMPQDEDFVLVFFLRLLKDKKKYSPVMISCKNSFYFSRNFWFYVIVRIQSWLKLIFQLGPLGLKLLEKGAQSLWFQLFSLRWGACELQFHSVGFKE